MRRGLQRCLQCCLQRAAAFFKAVLGGAVASGAAQAMPLPENKAELIYHVYDGGGVQATGPALLVRKSLADKVSLSAQYYVDAVSNASIDVVTTASPFKETRTAWDVGADLAVRDSLLSLSYNSSREPDYQADTLGLDVAQEVFGGMTTLNLGFSRARDRVGRNSRGQADLSSGGFFDQAARWQYRFGATQILSPRWLASLNFEAVADSGYLGSPYRAARVFGAAVPERNPRTRSSRAVKLRALGEVAPGTALRADYRHTWDNWDVRSHTFELALSRYFGPAWLADLSLRHYSQNSALFYSDNAQQETLYVSRNRQLSSFNTLGLGAKLSWALPGAAQRHGLKLTGVYELKRFRFKDFTDLRTDQPYAYDAQVLQLFITGTF